MCWLGIQLIGKYVKDSAILRAREIKRNSLHSKTFVQILHIVRSIPQRPIDILSFPNLLDVIVSFSFLPPWVPQYLRFHISCRSSRSDRGESEGDKMNSKVATI
jgi:hypothetical protein